MLTHFYRNNNVVRGVNLLTNIWAGVRITFGLQLSVYGKKCEIFNMIGGKLTRFRIKVRGIVQGVGFRPFVHRLVKQHGLAGWVRNSSEGAELELEGEEPELRGFLRELRDEAPPLAVIESVECRELPGAGGHESFRIIGSDRGDHMRTLVSPDTGICPDCLRELLDPSDRRYRYPFINCTNCGPRFTIIRSVPYDRAFTSMAEFPMCPDCAAEFADIENRRYHAQPDCCPVCGPRTFFIDGDGRRLPGDGIEAARRLIKDGGILCVKGLGGMHLACLAENEEAARELRRRKHRDEKPFAVMCRDIDCARRLCEVSEAEARALGSFRKPIVLLDKRERGALTHLSENNALGVMLPYTPLHVMLFGDDLDCLVMTSANLSDTPIVYKNAEALEKLRGIADGFLLHDREILTRCDDSLLRVYEGRDYPVRRSRGYVPYPITIKGLRPGLLACGAEQKAGFCLSKEGHAFPSQHIGDLKNLETLDCYEEQLRHFAKLFDFEPVAVACDMHPDYLSTEAAERIARERGIPLLRVQHHHAHMVSCMADNGLEGECLGLVWDGTGYGPDGTIWGGELLAGGARGFRRLGTMRPIPLPGGDAATKEIWRTAEALRYEAGLENNNGTIKKLLERGLNCPKSSGMGRLFDGVCALAGIRDVCSYEGQGAVLLEAAADAVERGEYELAFYGEGGVTVFDWRPMVRQLASGGEAPGTVAAKFMNTLVSAAVRQCLEAAELTGLRRVVLSGGVFQNMYLMARLPGRLREAGFEVFTHSRVSANDEGVALGQLMILEAEYVSGGTAENS